MTIQRQSWLGQRSRMPQDFFQFPDPIAIVLDERVHLEDSPEALAGFDELMELYEQELAIRLPLHWSASNDARMEARVAHASNDPIRIQNAARKSVRH